jgi:hypothetical protein
MDAEFLMKNPAAMQNCNMAFALLSLMCEFKHSPANLQVSSTKITFMAKPHEGDCVKSTLMN